MRVEPDSRHQPAVAAQQPHQLLGGRAVHLHEVPGGAQQEPAAREATAVTALRGQPPSATRSPPPYLASAEKTALAPCRGLPPQRTTRSPAAATILRPLPPARSGPARCRHGGCPAPRLSGAARGGSDSLPPSYTIKVVLMLVSRLPRGHNAIHCYTFRVALRFGQRRLEPFGSTPTGGHLYIVTTKLPFAPEVT